MMDPIQTSQDVQKKDGNNTAKRVSYICIVFIVGAMSGASVLFVTGFLIGSVAVGFIVMFIILTCFYYFVDFMNIDAQWTNICPNFSLLDLLKEMQNKVNPSSIYSLFFAVAHPKLTENKVTIIV